MDEEEVGVTTSPISVLELQSLAFGLGCVAFSREWECGEVTKPRGQVTLPDSHPLESAGVVSTLATKGIIASALIFYATNSELCL
jgi:hypothetical protein